MSWPESTKAAGQLTIAEKGWKRMVVQLADHIAAEKMTNMMQEIRAEQVTKTEQLECSHPTSALFETENQYSRWAKCLACDKK
eukprot:5245236-Pyramimonas_sp.AAC.1